MEQRSTADTANTTTRPANPQTVQDLLALPGFDLLALFDCICRETGVNRWICVEDGGFFDCTPDDLRDALRKLDDLVCGSVPLSKDGHRDSLEADHALKVLAWKFELDCLTDCRGSEV